MRFGWNALNKTLVPVLKLAKRLFSIRLKGLGWFAFSGRFLPDQQMAQSTFLYAVTWIR